jgi:5-formyltetrahydrofolate cyclo-ligase
MTDKSALRAAMMERRAAACAANPLAGLTLAARLPSETLPPPGAVVSAYWPFGSEIDPRSLMTRLRGLGYALALPVTPKKGSNAPLHFRRWTPQALLQPSGFGVHEPGEDSEILVPDLLLVPLLAFGRRGGRLGYGAGHYDRTLQSLRAAKPTIRAIGLAFAAQEVETLPLEPHDEPLDAVLTERAYIPIT